MKKIIGMILMMGFAFAACQQYTSATIANNTFSIDASSECIEITDLNTTINIDYYNYNVEQDLLHNETYTNSQAGINITCEEENICEDCGNKCDIIGETIDLSHGQFFKDMDCDITVNAPAFPAIDETVTIEQGETYVPDDVAYGLEVTCTSAECDECVCDSCLQDVEKTLNYGQTWENDECNITCIAPSFPSINEDKEFNFGEIWSSVSYNVSFKAPSFPRIDDIVKLKEDEEYKNTTLGLVVSCDATTTIINDTSVCPEVEEKECPTIQDCPYNKYFSTQTENCTDVATLIDVDSKASMYCADDLYSIYFSSDKGAVNTSLALQDTLEDLDKKQDQYDDMKKEKEDCEDTVDTIKAGSGQMQGIMILGGVLVAVFLAVMWYSKSQIGKDSGPGKARVFSNERQNYLPSRTHNNEGTIVRDAKFTSKANLDDLKR